MRPDTALEAPDRVASDVLKLLIAKAFPIKGRDGASTVDSHSLAPKDCGLRRRQRGPVDEFATRFRQAGAANSYSTEINVRELTAREMGNRLVLISAEGSHA